mgnify:CR=1 FL=1
MAIMSSSDQTQQSGEHGAGALPGGVVDDREHEEQCRAHGAHHHLADGASEREPYVQADGCGKAEQAEDEVCVAAAPRERVLALEEQRPQAGCRRDHRLTELIVRDRRVHD